MSVAGRSVPKATGLRSNHAVRDVLKSGHLRDPEVLRFFLVSSQCRGPINYSLVQVQIEQADAALGRLYTALRGVTPATTVTARAARNLEESDRIRDVLAAAGVHLEDQPDKSTTWRYD